MAGRKSKTLTVSEQLEKIEISISEKEKELKELKVEKKRLLDEKKKEDMEELYLAVKNSGKTIEEIKAMLGE